MGYICLYCMLTKITVNHKLLHSIKSLFHFSDRDVKDNLSIVGLGVQMIDYTKLELEVKELN